MNRPGFVVMLDPKGDPISDLNLPPGMTREVQRQLLDSLRDANQRHLASRADQTDLAARIATYELAYQMQQHVPEAVDLAQETSDTHAMYGLDHPRTADFGRRCLLARRLVERGVRRTTDARTPLARHHPASTGLGPESTGLLLRSDWTRNWSASNT